MLRIPIVHKLNSRIAGYIVAGMFIILVALTIMFTVFARNGVGGQTARTCSIEGLKAIALFSVLLVIRKLRGSKKPWWWI